MKGPLTTLAICLIVVLGALGYGWYERAQGAKQEAASQHADSLLHASQIAQDSILRADSLRSAQADSMQTALRRSLAASRAQRMALASKADSLASRLETDSVVPRDSVAALVGAFQEERAAAASQIALLEADTALLERTVAGKDSTIRALTQSLEAARAGWKQALQPHGPGLIERAGKLAELVLAVRGGVAFALGK